MKTSIEHIESMVRSGNNDALEELYDYYLDSDTIEEAFEALVRLHADGFLLLDLEQKILDLIEGEVHELFFPLSPLKGSGK